MDSLSAHNHQVPRSLRAGQQECLLLGSEHVAVGRDKVADVADALDVEVLVVQGE